MCSHAFMPLIWQRRPGEAPFKHLAALSTPAQDNDFDLLVGRQIPTEVELEPLLRGALQQLFFRLPEEKYWATSSISAESSPHKPV